jgi:predicted histone-like DNA-binding protein
MKFRKVQRSNPQNLAAPKKWYASPVNAGTLTLKEFAERISGRSSLTVGDVLNVLSNFLDEIPLYLEIGMSIQLGDFGTLRLSLASEGVENPDDFTVANITGVKVIFTPSSALKKALANVRFEEAKK